MGVERTLESLSESWILFEAVAGSHAYGTSHAGSDEDIRGVFVEPKASLLRLGEAPKQVGDERGDIVYFSLRRFLELAAAGNPNILELLFLPRDLIRRQRPSFSRVVEERFAFVTKNLYEAHVGYAAAQIRKARGKNKWINNPQPESAPEAIDFCWLIPRNPHEGLPFRPISLDASGIDLSQCHAASLERAANMYRIYDYGVNAKGVFRGGRIVPESIPLEDERSRCVGLLIFNEQAYNRAKADHRHYWEWRRHRNESRWTRQEDGALDYDAKNMGHMMRLLFSARNILREGAPLVRVTGKELAYLQSILNGSMTYDDIMRDAEVLLREMEPLVSSSALPESVDIEVAENLLIEVTEEWEASND